MNSADHISNNDEGLRLTKHFLNEIHVRYCVANYFSSCCTICHHNMCHIGGVLVSMLASWTVGCGLQPRWGHTEDYTIGICCFSAGVRNWFPRYQNNVS